MRVSHDTLFHVYIFSFRRRRRFAPAFGGRSCNTRAITPPTRAVAFPRSGIGIVVIRGRAGRIPTKRGLITPRVTPRRGSRLRNAFGGRTRGSRSTMRSCTRCRGTCCHHSVVLWSRQVQPLHTKQLLFWTPSHPCKALHTSNNLRKIPLTLSRLCLPSI